MNLKTKVQATEITEMKTVFSVISVYSVAK
jgi:hypothetical protein